MWLLQLTPRHVQTLPGSSINLPLINWFKKWMDQQQINIHNPRHQGASDYISITDGSTFPTLTTRGLLTTSVSLTDQHSPPSPPGGFWLHQYHWQINIPHPRHQGASDNISITDRSTFPTLATRGRLTTSVLLTDQHSLPSPPGGFWLHQYYWQINIPYSRHQGASDYIKYMTDQHSPSSPPGGFCLHQYHWQINIPHPRHQGASDYISTTDRSKFPILATRGFWLHQYRWQIIIPHPRHQGASDHISTAGRSTFPILTARGFWLH